MNKRLDWLLFFEIRLKLIVRDKITIRLFVFITLLFLFMSSSLLDSAEDKSKIPIGVVNLDKSRMSDDLVARVKKNETLYVMEGSEDKMNRELKNQKIEGIFMIKENYERRVMSGDIMEVAGFFYLEENTLSPFLIDVLGGEMMFDICLSKGMNLYYNLEESILAEKKVYSATEYINYINQLATKPEFNFTFQIETIDKNLPSNSLLYLQVAFAILGMLLAFLILFLMCNIMVDKEKGILYRLRTTNIGNISKNIGDILAVMAVILFLNLGLSFIIFLTLRPFGLKLIGSIFVTLMLYSIEYTILLWVFSRFFKSMTAFMTAGSFLVILFGLGGFLTIIDGVLTTEILKFFEFFPNSWFIQWITDIMA